MSGAVRLSDARVAILGLGLMGGSLALALRGKCALLSGSDVDPQTVARARKMGLLDLAHVEPGRILPGSDLILLAAPVRAVLELLRRLPSLHPGSAVVMDVGSTKGAILEAMDHLPPRFDPIGAHPMCGKETCGLEHAEAGLFTGAAFALTSLPRTSPRAQALAERLVHALGARPVRVDAKSHDAWAAAVSHLPYLLAIALTSATPAQAQALIGPGFRSSSRLAASETDMMLDTLITNRDQVLAALQRFKTHLETLRQQIAAEDWAALSKSLQRAKERHEDLNAGRAQEGGSCA